MKSKAAKRTRIARVRRIQHDLVAADAAKAENHASMLESSAERLAALRNSLGANMGRASGASLANLGELAMRLDDARQGLTAAINNARANATHQSQLRLEARQRQESAAKLEARAADALAQFIERNSFTSGRRKTRTLAGDNA